MRTLSAEGTKAVAASLAGWLEPGDVVVLSGDLGAGKTTFTQGLGAGTVSYTHLGTTTSSRWSRRRTPTQKRLSLPRH